MAGGEPVRIPLDQPPAEVMKLIERCDAVLLPGSKADVDPAKYDAPRDSQTAPADAGRDTVDELLLQDAYNMRKPVEVAAGSRLAGIVASTVEISDGRKFVVPVNSSHHQAADVVGDGLRAVARSPQDGVIEALEGTSPDHFVLAVQWHPERSVDEDEPSRAIFRALVQAARVRHEKLKGEFESV
jgi:putative glutamine amidotransferase